MSSEPYMSDLPFDLDVELAPARPVRRKRVAFAIWFCCLGGAALVIALGLAPLLTP